VVFPKYSTNETRATPGTTKTTIIGLTALSIAILVPACKHSGSDPSTDAVRIALSRDAITYLPVHLAKKLGYYEEERLSVTINEFASLSKALEAVVGGDVTGGNTAPIQMAAEGRSLRGFLMLYRRLPLALAVSPHATGKINEIKDLKGHRAGVSSLGSPTHFFLNYLLAAQSVRIEEVDATATGTGSSSIAATEHGRVEATVLVGGPLI